ncbi:MAG: hypothetical protein DSM107014_02310 [Gomphosphaeria aponina SAG 52.96 = DSM 107014]|uniref:Type I restriction modification DNA specificity domain-containing protein n=1 Tax=Gomphosphaeria aponina SAG 52.96 = DSM 107014 TaxID=1521640 RepID=A0A941GVB4_9CHRO|nr:hypothetical protein [Gomphosphaeria aponina SAG 52.96 = DSM 107014]
MSELTDVFGNDGFKQWPKYPVYKSSGVDWLGDIPEHWGVTRLKNISTINVSNVDKKTVENEQKVKLCNYTDVYYNDCITDDSKFLIASASKEQIKKFILQKAETLNVKKT